MHDEAAYGAWVKHIRTCQACEEGTPEVGDEDYVCPEGKRLKAVWLSADEKPESEPEKKAQPTEFHLQVQQLVYKYLQVSGGDLARLATFAKAQTVCGEAIRSIVARSQLLGKTPTMDDWSQAEVLERIMEADRLDEKRGA